MTYPDTAPFVRTTLQDRLERETARLRQLAGADVRLVPDLAPGVAGIRVYLRGYTIVIFCAENYPAVAPQVLAAPDGGTLTPIRITWDRSRSLREVVMDVIMDLMIDKPIHH